MPRSWCHTVARIMPTVLATDGRHHQLRNPMTSMDSAWHAKVWYRRPLAPFSLSLSLCNSWRKDTISVPRCCQHHAHHSRNRWPPSPAVPSSRKHGLGRACKLVAEPPLFPDFPLSLSLQRVNALRKHSRVRLCNLALCGTLLTKVGHVGLALLGGVHPAHMVTRVVLRCRHLG